MQSRLYSGAGASTICIAVRVPHRLPTAPPLHHAPYHLLSPPAAVPPSGCHHAVPILSQTLASSPIIMHRPTPSISPEQRPAQTPECALCGANVNLQTTTIAHVYVRSHGAEGRLELRVFVEPSCGGHLHGRTVERGLPHWMRTPS